jgi:hypothetical protein
MTVTTNPAQSRFQVGPVASAPFPSKCICCGAVDRDVVDFGVTYDFEGAVLLCVSCMAEGALKIGFVSGVTYHEALNLADRVTKNLDRAVALIKEFQGDLNDTVSDLVVRVDDALTSSPSNDGVDFDEKLLEYSAALNRTGQEDSGTDGQDAGAVSFEGSDDLPSSPSSSIFS